ncbi:glycerophosphoryl diester phosphodiesterase [Aneurinibacillus soli]|uniref:Glycerophosphoryl diester phosphodiesterase n=1 Tax=Aneurinibacillus soli TaxID=1500254 RepID=A0A0U4WC77_9BACL|nr:glycerophosphodiester phosphodiesterase family protein [Aneurinibacillus soli]PYE60102.1 glycerophosphoryl diester phosphodiesterase [Aneurinibacillus soli]BAU26409.1 Glycerophosphoryl diester phosphodiesterase [Aneurinibacillus soli]
MNICMAHRGWSGRAPENTRSAIRLALAESRIHSIELDVQLTKDGVPVVIHDFVLGRTANGSGPVGSHTYAELRQLDAGSWFGAEFRGECIPSFEEVLQEVKGRGRLNIELKTVADLYPGLEEKVVQLIHHYGMQHDVYVTSFDHDAIKRVNEIDSSLRTGLIFEGKPTLLREQLSRVGASLLSMSYMYLTKEFVVEMIESGILIVAWTVDDPKVMQHLMGFHPDLQICTNHPDRMLGLMR